MSLPYSTKGPFEGSRDCLASICILTHVPAASVKLKAVQIIHGMTLIRKWPETGEAEKKMWVSLLALT